MKSLSFDVEGLVLKIFNEFSCSAKRAEKLKSCFEFVQQDYHKVLSCVPTQWLSLFTAVERLLLNWPAIKVYFLEVGDLECDKLIWKFVGDQENAISERLTLPECYIYFVHSVMAIFQKAILVLEKDSTNATELYEIMSDVQQQLTDRERDRFFGFQVNRALPHLPVEVQRKFRDEASSVYTCVVAYLEKWFSFEDSPFKVFSSLNFKTVPSLDDLMKLDYLLKANSAAGMNDNLYTEYCVLRTAAPALIEDDSLTRPVDKWCAFFKKVECPTLLRMVKFRKRKKFTFGEGVKDS
ncbi:UNVERIFIED_CONTAM: hypothetical protein FKN15_029330 [Acipenser sinensis]